MSVKDVINELPKVKIDSVPEEVIDLFSEVNTISKSKKNTNNDKTETSKRRLLITDKIEKKIFELFLSSNNENLNIDFISEQLNVSTSSLLGKLLLLELKKIIVREQNNYFSLAPF